MIRALFISVCVMSLLLSAACNRKVTQVHSQQYQQDSVVVKERIVRDTVKVPGEVLEVEVPVPGDCDSVIDQLLAVKESNRARISISKKNKTSSSPSKLVVRADCKEYEAEIARKDREISRLKNDVRTEVVTKVVSKRHTAWYHKWAMWIAGVLLAYIALRLLWKYVLSNYIKIPFL